MRVAPVKDPAMHSEYSITADVLSFRRCSRQYGHFAVYGFVPAQATQLYFGIVIHQVLDRAHRQFLGRVDGKAKGVPSDADIGEHFRAVTEALRARGIRPYSRRAEDSAKDYLVRFNSTWGPSLYPLVVDTEAKLKCNMRSYILTGVVDVLARSPPAGGPAVREIWDYKGSHRVDDDSKEMADYKFQMQVYAELYRRRFGELPAQAVLCFIPETEPAKMFVTVPFDEATISKAMEEFARTVEEIERRKGSDDWSPPLVAPSRETCSACDIRWDCPTVNGQFRRPPL